MALNFYLCLLSAFQKQKYSTSHLLQPARPEQAQLVGLSRKTTQKDNFSIVNMMQSQVFSMEGPEYCRFELFRMYNLDQCVCVKYSTAENRGTAIAGHHYTPTRGTAVFEKGSNLTHFDVSLHDDEGWEVCQLLFLSFALGILLLDVWRARRGRALARPRRVTRD